MDLAEKGSIPKTLFSNLHHSRAGASPPCRIASHRLREQRRVMRRRRKAHASHTSPRDKSRADTMLGEGDADFTYLRMKKPAHDCVAERTRPAGDQKHFVYEYENFSVVRAVRISIDRQQITSDANLQGKHKRRTRLPTHTNRRRMPLPYWLFKAFPKTAS